ncbi:MAG: peptidoglycan bridge formation glycyltransferase FemA/FemB family protein [Spirochaetales bacterium]
MRSLEVEPCEPATLDTAASFLQTSWWAAFKGQHGWKSLAFRVQLVDGGLTREFPLSVLLRRLPLGLTLAYAPHAAVTAPEAVALGSALKRHLPRSTLCVRWDLLGEVATEGAPTNLKGLQKPPADVQPPDTVIVPLLPDDALLAGMHKKTRYNIGLAEKKGVTVEKAGVEGLADWYALYRETAERDRISIHTEAYYRDLFSQAPDLALWLARFEGKLLAGNIVLVHGFTATYLYGASSNEHRNLMAPYALQAAAMRDARERGATEYDLFGIPPTDDENHPMHGLYRFKTGFGGRVVHRLGAWDSVHRPLEWLLWTRADAARVWYHKVWRKRV